MSVFRKRANAGYSLVEITLALLVAAVGILSAFGLFPLGLNASRRAVDSTEVSAFADYVFAALEEAVREKDWGTIKDDFELSYLQPIDWGETDPIKIGEVKTFIWYPPEKRYGEDRLKVGGKEIVQRYQFAKFTYILDVGTVVGNVKYARLEVWPGDVDLQVTADPNFGNSTIFYREFKPMQ